MLKDIPFPRLLEYCPVCLSPLKTEWTDKRDSQSNIDACPNDCTIYFNMSKPKHLRSLVVDIEKVGPQYIFKILKYIIVIFDINEKILSYSIKEKFINTRSFYL